MQMNRAYAVGCLGWGKSRLNSRWKNASRYKYVISAPRVRENRWSALEKNVAGPDWFSKSGHSYGGETTVSYLVQMLGWLLPRTGKP
jgi:hypothetical protein